MTEANGLTRPCLPLPDHVQLRLPRIRAIWHDGLIRNCCRIEWIARGYALFLFPRPLLPCVLFFACTSYPVVVSRFSCSLLILFCWCPLPFPILLSSLLILYMFRLLSLSCTTCASLFFLLRSFFASPLLCSLSLASLGLLFSSSAYLAYFTPRFRNISRALDSLLPCPLIQLYLPHSLNHDAKKRKIVNCGVVAFTFER